MSLLNVVGISNIRNQLSYAFISVVVRWYIKTESTLLTSRNTKNYTCTVKDHFHLPLFIDAVFYKHSF